MLGGLSAANAGIAELLFLERNAARLNSTGDVLELLFAFGVSAPHSTDKSGLLFSNVKELLIIESVVSTILEVIKGTLVKLVVNALQSCLDLVNDVVKRHDRLLTSDAADQYAAVVFDIARTKLKAYRNALHLVL